MVFFESWSGLLALFLFLPFLSLLRRQKPVVLVVGGLEPFQAVAATGSQAERRRPFSFWLFLLAFLIASLALCKPASDHSPPLLILDQSASVLHRKLALPLGFVEQRVLGSESESIGQKEILLALQQVRPGREVVVWTDQPTPDSLPNWIDWRNQDFLPVDEPPGVILQALPVDATHWNVSWALDKDVSARITCGDWSSKPLSGLSGVTLVEVAHPGTDLKLKFAQLASTSAPVWGSIWPSPALGFQIPMLAHSAWKDAVLAVWPSIELSDGEHAGVLIQGRFQEAPSALQGFPWELEPQPQGIAWLAKTIREVAMQAVPPRDVREYMPNLLQPNLDANAFLSQPIRTYHGLPFWVFGALWLGVCSVALAWWKLPDYPTVAYSEV